jgi:ribosomal-protein-alanine N-acetyltransferase
MRVSSKSPQSITIANASELDDIADLLLQDPQSSWSLKSIDDSLQKAGYHFRKAYIQKNFAAPQHCVGFYFVHQVVDQLTLLSIFVAPQYRQQGIARYMLNDMVRFALAQQCSEVLLEVRQSNCAAIGLYETLNFIQVGCRRGYYPAVPNGVAETEDALLFSLKPELAPGADYALC